MFATKTWMFAGSMAAAGALFCVGTSLNDVRAQGAQWPAARVAVVNVQKVFKDYSKFKNLMDALKTDVDAKEQELKALDKIRLGKIESLKQVKNQADRDRIEKEVRDIQFEMEKSRQRYQTEFVQREADVYSAIYKEMTDMLTAYCETNQILIVLRTSTEMEPNNPQSVLQTVYKDVIYNHKNLDLTEVLAAGMNNAQGAAPKPAASK